MILRMILAPVGEHGRNPTILRILRPVFFLLVYLQILTGAGWTQAQSPDEFYHTYIAHYFTGLHNPAAANARVFSIWTELVKYSKHMFPVYPAEQFNLGEATPAGIYLDLSVAADPNPEVTRFFLAHEWGHMMHGDPLNTLSLVGQYKMVAGAAGAEERADTYAATFMRYQDHEIQPVIEFFCSLPDAGPEDPHGSGALRAARVAATYGSPDKNVEVPCKEKAEGFCQVLTDVIDNVRHDFNSLRGDLIDADAHLYRATSRLPGASKCLVSTADKHYQCSFQDRSVSDVSDEVSPCARKPKWTRVEDENSVVYHTNEDDEDEQTRISVHQVQHRNVTILSIRVGL